MITAVIIIIAVVIFIIYSFQSDKKEEIRKAEVTGGLKRRFPNFVAYARQAYASSEPFLEFVKDTGQFLEYRFPLKGSGSEIVGYYHLGIESIFGTMAYVFAISNNGYKHQGYFREIHNGKTNTIPDLGIEEYTKIFDQLLSKMEHSPEYAKLGFG